MLQCPYDFEKAKLIVREMTDLLVLDLADKGLVTDQIELNIGYDIENLTDAQRRAAYAGPVTTDYYGRSVPKAAHGTENLGRKTSSTKRILGAAMFRSFIRPACHFLYYSGKPPPLQLFCWGASVFPSPPGAGSAVHTIPSRSVFCVARPVQKRKGRDAEHVRKRNIDQVVRIAKART